MAQNQLRPEQSQFLTDVRQILLDLSWRLQQDVGDDVVDYALFRLQQLSRHLARFAHAAQVYEEVQADLDMIASLLTEADRNFPCQYVDLNAGTSYSGGPGRPWREISREQLEYLVENDISIPDIAQVLGVSVSTVKRRLREFGISNTERKTPISDTDLDAKLKTNQRILPFVTQYQPSVPNLKQILMKNWHLIEQQPLLSEIYKKPPLVSYKRGRSLKDILVRAKL